MQIDTDVMFFHDPYQFLKTPPLSQYQVGMQGAARQDVEVG